MISEVNQNTIDNINKGSGIWIIELCNLNYCNQKLRTKTHMHDPTRFPNIYFREKKAQHNIFSFRFQI